MGLSLRELRALAVSDTRAPWPFRLYGHRKVVPAALLVVQMNPKAR